MVAVRAYSSRCRFWSILGLGMWVTLVASVSVQNRKLSGPMQFTIGGDVLEARLTPDGVWAVYRADQDTDGKIELYRVPTKGGAPQKLNGALPFGGSVDAFLVSADSSHIVYLADQDTSNIAELYSVSLEGRRIRLNPAFPPSHFRAVLPGFQISLDSARVVYVASQDTVGVFELYSVPLGGGASIRLNPALAGLADVKDFQISPDSSRVVFQIGDAPGVIELYSVSIAGGPTIKLNATLVTDGDVVEFRISRDSSRVVYLADQDLDEVFELHSVPIDGGPVARLNAPLVAGGDVVSGGFQLSSDSLRVVYRADQETDGTFELYGVPIGGGAVVKLNEPAIAGDVLDFEVSPDARQVVYRADQERALVFELYSVPIGGGYSIKLNGVLVERGTVFEGFEIAPDSTRVVYRADQEVHNKVELYSTPLRRVSPTRISAPFGHAGDVGPGFRISPDSSRVVHRASANQAGAFELFSVGIDGGEVVQLSDPVAAPRSVQVDVHVSPDSTHVIYRGEPTERGVFELLSVPILGQRPAIRLNEGLAPLVLLNDVVRFEISPDGSRAVYWADQDASALYELFSAPLCGEQPPVKLNPPLVPGGDVWSHFRISQDSSRVAYVASQDRPEVLELYSVPLAGGESVKLNGVLVPRGNVFMPATEPFVISPDSRRVVYRADQERDELWELFSVPIEGGTAVKLNGPLVSGGDVFGVYSRGFQVSPDSLRVIYLADQEADEVFDLYSVPIDGGTPIKLNAPFGAHGDAWASFDVSPDSTRVVFHGSETPYLFELYSVPIDGGTVTKLNPSLVDSGSVSAVSISSDSRHVVYLANQENFQSVELYSVPIDGGPVTKLNGPLPPNGDVAEFEFISDSLVLFRVQAEDYTVELRSVAITGGETKRLSIPGKYVHDFQIASSAGRVVYSAGRNPAVELYSVGLSGGPSTRLKAPLFGSPPFGYRISADEEQVLYLSWRGTEGVGELYGVSIYGGESTRLNGPLVDGGDVAHYTHGRPDGFQISSDSRRVVYLADQDRDEVAELYLSLFNGPERGGRLGSESTDLPARR